MSKKNLHYCMSGTYPEASVNKDNKKAYIPRGDHTYRCRYVYNMLFPLPSAFFTCCPLHCGNQHSPTVLLALWMNHHRSYPFGKRGNHSNQHRLTLGNSLINFLWTTLILAIRGDVNKKQGGTFCTLRVITDWKQNLTG